MTGDLPVFVGAILLCVALAVAAGTDLAWRIIPNWLNLAIAIAAPVMWVAQGMDIWPTMAWQIAVAVAVFVPFLLMFNFGAMGGGDVKLIAALALWIPPRMIMTFLFVMALVGGLIAAFMLVQTRLRHNAPAVPESGSGAVDASATPAAPEVPYGVAIAIAGWWVVYQQYLNHFPANPDF